MVFGREEKIVSKGDSVFCRVLDGFINTNGECSSGQQRRLFLSSSYSLWKEEGYTNNLSAICVAI